VRKVIYALAFTALTGAAFAQDQLPNGAEAGEKPNPLPGIVDKMKTVEKKLAEAEAGELTQAEQQAIAKALDIDQGGLVSELQKLIDEIESSAQSGGQGGDPSGSKRPQGSKGAQKQPKKERDQGGQEKPANPDQPSGQQEQSKSQPEQTENDRKSKNDPGDNEYSKDPSKRPGGQGEPWGTLPPKQRGEVIDASKREKPPAWRKQIDEYLKKLAQPKK
jgi:hypothetical protein